MEEIVGVFVAISGDLGSGKSSVAKQLAASLGYFMVSTGAMQREKAATWGMSTLETNRRAELDARIDSEIDAELVRLSASQEDIVFDSRMAWHFIDSSVKVHLIVDPMVGAERVLAGRSTPVERYDSHEAALRSIESRRESESERFAKKYDVDIARLRNYHLVIDTTEATVAKVVSVIEGYIRAQRLGGFELWVSPKRVLPGDDAVMTVARSPQSAVAAAEAIEVAYARPFFFVIGGYPALSAAIAARLPLVPAQLYSEGNERLAWGMTTRDYLLGEVRPSWVFDWEAAHGFRFTTYPTFSRS